MGEESVHEACNPLDYTGADPEADRQHRIVAGSNWGRKPWFA